MYWGEFWKHKEERWPCALTLPWDQDYMHIIWFVTNLCFSLCESSPLDTDALFIECDEKLSASWYHAEVSIDNSAEQIQLKLILYVL